MVPSLLLTWREGLEAALVISLVLGALRKIERGDLNRVVWFGALAGVLGSLGVAVGLELIGAEFEGPGEQLFEGFALLIAAGILTWMILWMGRQAASMRSAIEKNVHQAAFQQSKRALFLLSFVVVIREGIELALFLLAARLASNPGQTLLGAAIGICLALLMGWLIFTSSRKVSLARFFQVTNIFLIIFAAGLVGLSVSEFNEAGIIPVVAHLWNLSAIMPEDSMIGSILRTLFGYSANPSLSQVLIYLVYFAAAGWLLLFRKKAVKTA
jgi:high-affinity iron transporter